MDTDKLRLDEVVPQSAEAEELVKKLQDLFPKVDEKTQKMFMATWSGLSLEHQQDFETRIFCVFYNNKTGKYRVTGADAVIVDNIKTECSFAEAISSMIKYAKEVGVKIFKKDINV